MITITCRFAKDSLLSCVIKVTGPKTMTSAEEPSTAQVKRASCKCLRWVN